MQVLFFLLLLALSDPVLLLLQADINTVLVDLQIKDAEKQIYHCGKTVAEVYVKKSNPLDIVLCSLRETESSEAKQGILRRVHKNVVITKLKLPDMLDMIETCNNHLSAQKISTDTTDMTDPLDVLKMGMKNTRMGSVSGTLWCGRGNDAGSFSQLGPSYKVDRCCRQHDMCPWDQKSLTPQNPTPYTLSLCECDKIFFECLKSIKSSEAARVGRLFFNDFKIDCIELKKNPVDNSVLKVPVPSQLVF